MAPCCSGPHRCTNASKCGFSSHFSSVGEALVQACLLLFFFQMQTSLYYHNKNKSVLYFTIYFKYFHYEAWISPTWSTSVQPSPKMEAARNAIRRHIACSRTSPPSQPRPQTRIHLCIQRSISASCSSEVHSTAHQYTRLYIPSEILSLLSDRRHNPAASDNNLLSVPLDKKFLESKEIRAFKKERHCRFGRVTKEKSRSPFCHWPSFHLVTAIFSVMLETRFMYWWHDLVFFENASFRSLFPAKRMLYM